MKKRIFSILLTLCMALCFMPKGVFAEGETVTLYYDPDDLEKMYVEGDKSVLGAEVLYVVLGVVLLVLMAGIVR